MNDTNQRRYIWFVLYLLLGLLCVSACSCRDGSNGPTGELAKLKMPPGFQIAVFADNVPDARSLARGTKGTIFVSNRKMGKVYALVDADQDNKAEKVYTIWENGFMPNGIAFRDGSLYLAEVNRVLRFDQIEDKLANPPKPVVIYDKLPDKTHHGWKFIRFGPDGYLYVPVGAPCNVCEEKDERFSTIMRMKPDGSGLEIFAKGVRNTVGFDFHPTTKELWFTDNGRDRLGDNIPPCELNHAPTKGLHFGFPYCHGKDVADPTFGKTRKCAEFRAPAQELGPHVAPLGMRFYTGTMLPKAYRNQILIAEHGSWNRSEKIGYRVTLVELQGNKAISYKPLVEGWLQGQEAWGRPVDLLQMPDGSVLISDDFAGKIYRLSYKAP